jgi:glucose-1-phosphate cytidylyltransferase
MKVVILCGGLGSRLAEETQIKPKPMVEIGGKPILWHIMKSYSQFGFEDFMLPLGYKAEIIKEYFLNYHALSGDLRVTLSTGGAHYINRATENWEVQMHNTGDDTLTGGRLKRLEPYLRSHGTFMLTYGDGVCDVDIKALLAFHKSHGKIATMTSVRPSARFGTMSFNNDQVTAFSEKSQTDSGWINGGFFVFEPEVFDYLNAGDQTILERAPLEALAQAGQLHAFKHDGFWQCMDTIRDKQYLESLCSQGEMPWLKAASQKSNEKLVEHV